MFLIGLLVCSVVTIGSYGDPDDKEKIACRYSMKGAMLGLVLVFISIFIPTKQTFYTMVIAKNLTPQTIELAKGEIKDVIGYLINQIKEMDKK